MTALSGREPVASDNRRACSRPQGRHTGGPRESRLCRDQLPRTTGSGRPGSAPAAHAAIAVALGCTRTAYREGVADEFSTWPQAGLDLIHDLARTGHLGLITGPLEVVPQLVRRFSDEVGVPVISIGRTLRERLSPPTLEEIEASFGSATILDEIELLFAPALHTNVLGLLALRAKRQPTIAVWPGEISNRRASYSIPPRPDHQAAELTAALILRPTRTRFPDEVPFQIERIPR